MAVETYLGDGLYASIDGWQTVRLRAPREEGDHVVYLEPSVWKGLQRYMQEQLEGQAAQK